MGDGLFSDAGPCEPGVYPAVTGLSLPPLNIPGLLRQFNLHPSKGLGQNFLQDNRALQIIISTAGLNPGEAVLEIGPGLGSLTRYLALVADTVTAVELDRKLFPVLETVLAPYKNVRLIQGDILNLDPAELMEKPGYVVVANIPYYITSMVIRHLLEAECRPSRVVLTVQKEVAERICAGGGKMSLLALSVQVYGEAVIGTVIPAEAFFPAPKVDSAVLRIQVHPEPVIPLADLDIFFKLIKAGFSQKRKTLRNALAAGLRVNAVRVENLLLMAGIEPNRRAETLTLVEWGILVDVYRNQIKI